MRENIFNMGENVNREKSELAYHLKGKKELEKQAQIKLHVRIERPGRRRRPCAGSPPVVMGSASLLHSALLPDFLRFLALRELVPSPSREPETLPSSSTCCGHSEDPFRRKADSLLQPCLWAPVHPVLGHSSPALTSPRCGPPAPHPTRNRLTPRLLLTTSVFPVSSMTRDLTLRQTDLLVQCPRLLSIHEYSAIGKKENN